MFFFVAMTNLDLTQGLLETQEIPDISCLLFPSYVIKGMHHHKSRILRNHTMKKNSTHLTMSGPLSVPLLKAYWLQVVNKPNQESLTVLMLSYLLKL